MVTSFPETEQSRAHFATTRWSLIWDAHPVSGEGVHPGLGKLCRIYWRPIYTFIARRGYSAADAQDLTQEFFLRVFDGAFLRTADPDRGRFRCLVLSSLKNFLIDVTLKHGCQKRGGGAEFLSLEKWIEDSPAQLSVPAQALVSCPPEALFDLGWATTIAQEALCRLRTECENKGRRRLFEVLHNYLTAERQDISYKDLSSSLGITEQSVKSVFHKFRIRFRALLREEIAKTLADEANVEDEIRYLCAALSAGTGRPWN